MKLWKKIKLIIRKKRFELFRKVFIIFIINKTECKDNTYGQDCMYICGKCLDGAQCNQIDGSCFKGCDKGAYGAKCNKG